MKTTTEECEGCSALAWCLGHQELRKLFIEDLRNEAYISRCMSCGLLWVRIGYTIVNDLGEKSGVNVADLWVTELPHCLALETVEPHLLCDQCLEDPNSNYYKGSSA